MRRLIEELDDDVEQFVRMMDDEILLADRRETISAKFLDAFRKARIVARRKLELGAVDRHQLRQIVERQHSLDEHDPGRDHVDVAGDERAQQFWHAGFDLEPDDSAAPASLERALVQADEVFRLFLDFNVAVANDAKGAFAQHFVARKQEPDKRDNQPVKHHETRGPAKRAVGNRTKRSTLPGTRTSALMTSCPHADLRVRAPT